MPNSHVVHPDAEAEFDDIQNTTGLRTTQKVAAAAAWQDALTASLRNTVSGLRRGAVFQLGPVYVAEYPPVKSLFGSGTKAAAVVAVNTATGRVEVLACDVAGSPWWHGSSPEGRAGRRMT